MNISHEPAEDTDGSCLDAKEWFKHQPWKSTCTSPCTTGQSCLRALLGGVSQKTPRCSACGKCPSRVILACSAPYSGERSPAFSSFHPPTDSVPCPILSWFRNVILQCNIPTRRLQTMHWSLTVFSLPVEGWRELETQKVKIMGWDKNSLLETAVR